MFKFFNLVHLDIEYNKLNCEQKKFCLYITKQLIAKPQMSFKNINIFKKIVACSLLCVQNNSKKLKNKFILDYDAITFIIDNKYLNSIKIEYGFSYKYWAQLIFFMANSIDGFVITLNHDNAKFLITNFLLKDISYLPKDKTTKDLKIFLKRF